MEKGWFKTVIEENKHRYDAVFEQGFTHRRREGIEEGREQGYDEGFEAGCANAREVISHHGHLCRLWRRHDDCASDWGVLDE